MTPITVTLTTGESFSVEPFERQEIEPAMYCHTSGWWATRTFVEDGRELSCDYFVDDGGIVYDVGNTACGVAPEWKAAADKAEAELDAASAAYAAAHPDDA